MKRQTHILSQSGRPPIVLHIAERVSYSEGRSVTVDVVVCDEVTDDDYVPFLEWAHPIMADLRDSRTPVEFKEMGDHHLVDVLENLLDH